MTVARSADVLDEHVAVEVECIDRMYCSVYVPQLQACRRPARVRATAAWSSDRVDSVG